MKISGLSRLTYKFSVIPVRIQADFYGNGYAQAIRCRQCQVPRRAVALGVLGEDGEA